MHIRAVVLAGALAVAPLGAEAADLVVWWEQGYYPEEDAAVREIVAAFKQKTGKQVELLFYPQEELPERVEAALATGEPPDFAFGLRMVDFASAWAFDDRLVDLTGTVGHFSDLFDPVALWSWELVNEKTGRTALYALPMGRTSNHIHVWKSLLERAGFTITGIPKEWGAFWAFWCDQVQPAVRRAAGRDDIWGVGLSMSGESPDTQFQFFQFLNAYDADWVSRDGTLAIDDPETRQRVVKAIGAYTAIYRNGCTPPGSIAWGSGADNNQNFLAQTVVMTPNQTLSIPNALKHERPEDYYENTSTIEWPVGPDGDRFPIRGVFHGAVVFKDGRHVEGSEEFVRFLVGEGWLGHYLDFSGERMLPPMPKLLDAPFWLDPSDPHRMAAVMQIATRPMPYYTGWDWRYDLVFAENVWAKAVHRVAAEGISPEQAVDEAIARIKQILSE